MSKCEFRWVAPVLGLIVLAAASCLATTARAAIPKPEKLALWTDQAPIGDGKFEPAAGSITVHRPDPEKANGAAAVICPGGGYGGLVIGAEGHTAAEWLVQHGVTGIVLEYRLPRGRWHVPLLDAQRAIRTVRVFTPATGRSTRSESASWASRPAGIWLRRPARISTAPIPRRPIQSIA